ncbi:hypothetical protein [Salinivibrio socompensis]|uniref:hypothetical protein n=1 Tax=Salinivibrio socompensis TaxID=1510206 RepID=UPI001F0AA786|nr:hypothetical protein [Salinivibrio socompensis]
MTTLFYRQCGDFHENDFNDACRRSADRAIGHALSGSDSLAGGKVGADAWFMDADVNSVEADDASTSGSYYAALEHPLPLIPNAKIRQTSVSVDNLMLILTKSTLLPITNSSITT